jgi:hypothetical protein
MQLTERINQTQLQEKDPDAQNLLGRELGANSDALYIMAQTLLVQNMALEQLKSQVEQLKQQSQQQPAHATSFLGRLFGDKDQPQPPQAQSPQAQYQPPQQYQQPQQSQPPQQQGWQPVPNYQQAPPAYGQPQYGQPQYAQAQYGAVPVGQPSFLRGAMQTAAGVAAGALVFEGVESLLHPYGHGGGWGWGGGPGFGGGPAFGGGYERPVEETVINNNYYDQPGQVGGAEHHMADSGTGLNDQLDHDFGSEHHNESAQFADTNQDGSQFDQGSYDNSLTDNDSVINDDNLDNMQIDDSASNSDDSSSFDSGGGFDNSGSDGF